jgi:hypothetical protein
MKQVRLTVIFILLSFFFCFSVSAQVRVRTIDSIFKEGEKQLAEGSYSSAINNFARVLMANQSHAQANDSLLKLMYNDRLSGKEKASIITYQDLTGYNARLLDKINFYLSRRNNLVKDLLSKGFTQNQIDHELETFYTELLNKRMIFQSKIENPTDIDASSMENLLNALSLKKEELSSELENVERQYTQLKEFDHLEYERRLSQIRELPYLHSSTKDNPEFQNELAKLKTMLIDLQTVVAEKDKEVADLTLKVKNLITNTNQIPSESADKNLAKIQSKLDVSHEIIDEQNRQIQALKMDLERYKKLERPQITTLNMPPDAQLIELSGILDIYKGKLAEATHEIKEHTIYIAKLEEKLTDVQTALSEKDQIISKAQQDMIRLEGKLIDLQREFNNFKQSSGVHTLPHFTQLSSGNRISQLDNIQRFLEIEWKQLQTISQSE